MLARQKSVALSGLIAASSLAVIACGAADPPVILDTEKVERAIEQSNLAQRGRRTDVSCPSGVVQKKGVGFTCIATYRGGRARFTVTQTNGAGRVFYEAR